MTQENFHAMCIDCCRSTNDSRVHPVVHRYDCPQRWAWMPSVSEATEMAARDARDLEQAKKRLLAGEWNAISVVTLEQLTEHAWSRQGSFSMRLLAAEVWRLRKELRALREHLDHSAGLSDSTIKVTVPVFDDGWPHK